MTDAKLEPLVNSNAPLTLIRAARLKYSVREALERALTEVLPLSSHEHIRNAAEHIRAALETDTPDGMGEFLRTLCKQHGLTSASVSFTYAPPGPFFYAYVFWNDTDGEQRCVGKHGPDAETAVLCAIEAMKDKRPHRRGQ